MEEGTSSRAHTLPQQERDSGNHRAPSRFTWTIHRLLRAAAFQPVQDLREGAGARDDDDADGDGDDDDETGASEGETDAKNNIPLGRRKVGALGHNSDVLPHDDHEEDLADVLDVVDDERGTLQQLAMISDSIIYPRFRANPGGLTRTLTSMTTASTLTRATGAGGDVMLEEDGGDSTKAPLRVAQNAYHKNTRHRIFSILQGVWAFVKTGPGIFAAIYIFLVVFSGAALVLFLAGWVDHGKNKDYWVEVFSQFINALFTIPGVGLIPWRIRDTYYVIRLAHYQHLTWRLRRERGLKSLPDKHDFSSESQPVPRFLSANTTADPVEDVDPHHPRMRRERIEQVLSNRQAAKMKYLQTRLSLSQPWYRPHATWARKAFPLGTAMLIVFLFDFNSIFQCLLCAAMWGYATHYKDRPTYMTAALIPLSFLCGILAGVAIARGTQHTKRKKVVEEKIKDTL